MPIFSVDTQCSEIDFAPDHIHTEILQNVRTILTTPRYSVPLDRNFGINAILIDVPISAAQALLTAEIIEAVEQYEPRVRVLRVIYEGDAQEGILVPKVQVEIRGT